MCTLPGVTYHIPSRSYVVVLVSTFAGVFPLVVIILYYMINHISRGKLHKVNHIYLSILYMFNHMCSWYNNSVKGGDLLAPTEAQKRASAKYQKENIASLACRVKKEQAEKFKSYCKDIGKTSNAVLRDYVLDCIDEKGESDGD